ncbi:MAG: APC family permease [Thermoplasmata archaeon]
MAEGFSSGYKKDLSLFNLVMLNSMGMIGSGWLFAALYTSSYAGSFGSILSWIIGAAIVLLVAVTFMEVSTAFPLAGGSTPIGEFSHGKLGGFVAGWGAWISDIMTPPIEAVAMVTYLSFFVNGLITKTGVLLPLGYLVVVIVLLAILIVNLQAVRFFGNVTSGIMIWKWAIPALAVITLISFAFHPSNFTITGTFYQGYSGIFYALVLGGIVFSFEGFRGAINMAAESQHRDYIWKSVIVALLLVMTLYVFIQVAFIGALDWSKSGVAVGNWGALSNSLLLSGPFAKEAEFAGLGWLVVILLIDAVVSPGGAGLSYAAYPARIFQSMAEFGYAPSWFKNLTDKARVPGRALVLGFLVGLVFLYEFPGWHLLVGILTSTLVIAYVIGPASINILRKTAPDVERKYTLKGSKIIAPLGFMFSSLIIYWSGWPLSGEVVIAVVAGLFMFGYFTAKNNFDMREIKSGMWIVALLFVIAVLSYLGPSVYGGINIIPFPWDFIVTGVISLGFYGISQLSGIKSKSLERYLDKLKEEAR